ncbi:SUF system NifU family Fe-S cluster assembly protein [Noviherbaspirillum cavernae]|uniref:SUF system NifU family Fe-S cluster assembly protein n=1 Tax=Noviherbaspirillum cavernae TaxID=2320862 RepID=A0A418X6E9_9BURK|nr:SUF system NifU family Fe-S cluster assembly protein [Noviherbaspirillum cavernae]RJG08019.1 SUF system NifU family Fe-S cluster assembly protein [Noviherbaspirillum cavernae]
MGDLRDLYQEVIFDHYRKPRNFHALADANRSAEGFNPLCGDRLTLYLDVEDDVITDASFEGTGCAISMASASLMTEHIKGRRVQEAEKLFADFHELVTHEHGTQSSDLGKLEVLGGVREFPARVKCATLAWHTLRAALSRQTEPVSTE